MTPRLALVAATAALLAACAQSSGTTTALTEPQVRALVEKVEAATGTQFDAEVTGDAMADDATITWRGVETVVLKKDEFIEDMADTADAVEDHEYSYKVGAVRVAADGESATADVAVTSAFDFEGQKVEESADQVYTIELRDGEPKVVSIVSTTTRLTIDGENQL